MIDQAATLKRHAESERLNKERDTKPLVGASSAVVSRNMKVMLPAVAYAL